MTSSSNLAFCASNSAGADYVLIEGGCMKVYCACRKSYISDRLGIAMCVYRQPVYGFSIAEAHSSPVASLVTASSIGSYRRHLLSGPIEGLRELQPSGKTSGQAAGIPTSLDRGEPIPRTRDWTRRVSVTCCGCNAMAGWFRCLIKNERGAARNDVHKCWNTLHCTLVA